MSSEISIKQLPQRMQMIRLYLDADGELYQYFKI